jgi:serine/threonine-protein kinase
MASLGPTISRAALAPTLDSRAGRGGVADQDSVAEDVLIPLDRSPERDSDERAPVSGQYRFVALSRADTLPGKRVKSPVAGVPRLSPSHAPPTLRSAFPAAWARPASAVSATGSSASRFPAVGRVVAGRYRMDRILGEGGMGAVFQAHDLRLDIDVAVKFIRSDILSSQARERLRKEARAAARVSHPSAVRVLDFDIDEEHGPFLAMELLVGRSLADALLDGVFSPEAAVSTLLPIVGAVAVAHSEGIVHRDIKPGNILLSLAEDGGVVPKLVDFGVARMLASEKDRRITQAGSLIGSPEYMAPEQTQTMSNADARADVWALCVVLHELLTGQTPFRGPTVFATLALVRCQDPAPPPALAGEPELWSIVRRGLAKDPAERWGSAGELGKALAEWALGRGMDADAAGTSISYWVERTSRPTPEPPLLPR